MLNLLPAPCPPPLHLHLAFNLLELILPPLPPYTCTWPPLAVNLTHPLHLHLAEFYVCGRRNDMGGATGIRQYEILAAKDIVMLAPYDTVWFIARCVDSLHVSCCLS